MSGVLIGAPGEYAPIDITYQTLCPPNFQFGQPPTIFLEAQFPNNLSYGASGGFGWLTKVVVTNTGQEYRFQNWAQPLGRWTVGHNLRTPSQWGALMAFHRLVQGKTIGFRFQDWTDYTQEWGPGTGVNSGIIALNSSSTLQLFKNYSLTDEISFAVYTQTRPIVKPQPGTIIVTAPGGSPVRTGWTLDYTTGAFTTAGTIVNGDVWTGQFDVPVRFDTDVAMISVDKPTGAGWRTIPIVELRINV